MSISGCAAAILGFLLPVTSAALAVMSSSWIPWKHRNSRWNFASVYSLQTEIWIVPVRHLGFPILGYLISHSLMCYTSSPVKTKYIWQVTAYSTMLRNKNILNNFQKWLARHPIEFYFLAGFGQSSCAKESSLIISELAPEPESDRSIGPDSTGVGPESYRSSAGARLSGWRRGWSLITMGGGVIYNKNISSKYWNKIIYVKDRGPEASSMHSFKG